MPLALSVVDATNPDEVRRFPLGRFELFSLGGQTIGRAIYAPGWRWSKHVAPFAGTQLCELDHLGFVVAGRAAVRMADHTEVILEPGNFFSIPPGHDSWVLGDEQYVSLHLLAAEDYAAPQASGDEPPAAVSAPIGKHNAPLFTWGDGCEGWTLLSTPQLHVLQERMPPRTREQRHSHEHTRQLYFVLNGTATVEVAGEDAVVHAGEAIAVPPKASHQIRNQASEPLEFLVASSQPPRDDRSNLD